MRAFNIALLGKWSRRMLVDRRGLWYSVFVARYVKEVERLEDRGRSGSSWWREVVKNRDGRGVDGCGWFEENIVRRAGNDVDIFFCTDPLLGDSPLCLRYSRLFDLVVNKSISVAAMCDLGWEEGGEVWQGRRQLI